jgi:hypothetical protein
MSLPALDGQSQLLSTAALHDQLFGPTDRYRLFAQKIYPLLVHQDNMGCQVRAKPLHLTPYE